MSKSWGTPTWYFFHSFAHHINEGFYMKNKDKICNMLKSICLNLPCEDCTRHASRYTRGTLNSRNLKDKEALKRYFFDFHNDVNIKLRKPTFSDYDMYNKSNLSEISKLFFSTFGRHNNPLRGFSDQMNRNHIIDNMKTFLTTNSMYFKW